MKLWTIALIAMGIGASAFAQPPERAVQGRAVISRSDPAVTARVPSSAQYLGADRWTLYGVADAEVHVFAEIDEAGALRRLYWLQFEGFLPTKPDLKYNYNSARRAVIGGLEFHVDEVSGEGRVDNPDSDTGRVLALVRKSGYDYREGMRYLRLVHLVDDGKRKEFMIIYGDVVAKDADLLAAAVSRIEVQPLK